MDRINPSNDMFIQLIRSIHDAEKVLNVVLRKVKARAVAEHLKSLIDEVAEEKRSQQARLEGLFAIMGESPEGVADNVVRYLCGVKRNLLEECGDYELSDTIVIALNRAMTIHLIDSYRTTISWAINLGNPEIIRILRRSLLAETTIESKFGMMEELNTPVAELVGI
jgi:ferritin-like metal-binding protein YciE